MVMAKEFDSKNPNSAAHKFSVSYPECYVRVTWQDHEIVLEPKNMIRDRALVDIDEMSMSEFMKKWFPGKMAKKADVEIELEEEFKEQETI